MGSNETLAWRGRFHWTALFWPWLIAAIMGLPGAVLLLGVFAPGGSFEGTAVLAALALAFLGAPITIAVAAFANWQLREVVLTNRRLLVTSGTFKNRTAEVLLGEIARVNVHQGLLGKALGSGKLTLARRGLAVKAIRDLRDPFEGKTALQNQLNARGSW